MGAGAAYFATQWWQAWNEPAGPDWRPYDPPGGGFRVDMPGPAEEVPTPTHGRVIGNMHFYLATCPNTPMECGVIFFDQYGPDADFPALRLAKEVEDWVKKIPEQTLRSRQGFVDGPLRGEEVVVDKTDGSVRVYRAILVGRRTVVLLVFGNGLDPQGPVVRRFLDSFRVTDHVLAQNADEAAAWWKARNR